MSEVLHIVSAYQTKNMLIQYQNVRKYVLLHFVGSGAGDEALAGRLLEGASIGTVGIPDGMTLDVSSQLRLVSSCSSSIFIVLPLTK